MNSKIMRKVAIAMMAQIHSTKNTIFEVTLNIKTKKTVGSNRISRNPILVHF